MEFLWGEFLPVPEGKLSVLADNQAIEVYNQRLRALETSGHARHHFAYIFNDTCFSGDIAGVRLSGLDYVGLPTPPPEFHLEDWIQSHKKLQKELVALKEAVIKKEQQRFKIDSELINNKTDFGFYEELKETKRYNNDTSIYRKQETKDLSNDNVLKAKKSLVDKNGKASKADQRGNREVNKNFTIQVASLKDSKDADAIVANLKRKGFSAYRIASNIPGKGLRYRVRVGYFKDKAEASITINKLKSENFKAILVYR